MATTESGKTVSRKSAGQRDMRGQLVLPGFPWTGSSGCESWTGRQELHRWIDPRPYASQLLAVGPTVSRKLPWDESVLMDLSDAILIARGSSSMKLAFFAKSCANNLKDLLSWHLRCNVEVVCICKST